MRVVHTRIDAVTRAGLVLDVHDSGPLDGTPVVLLHGFPQTSSSWRAVTPLLHEAGLRTLALDQRGYSPRGRPRRRRDYRLDDVAADAAALLDRLGRPAHVVGHDWGGAVAWRLAAGRPDAVASLTAVSTPHPSAFLRSLAGRQAARSWYMALFQLPALPEALARAGLLEAALRRSGMPEDDMELFRREILADGALHTALGWYRGMPFTDPGAAAGRVRVPTTLVWSDGDTALGKAGVDATARWVDAPYRLVVLRGVSHWVPTEAPDALARAVVDRVSSVSSGAPER